MKRLLARFFGAKEYACFCGKQFRDEGQLSRHMWREQGFKV